MNDAFGDYAGLLEQGFCRPSGIDDRTDYGAYHEAQQQWAETICAEAAADGLLVEVGAQNALGEFFFAVIALLAPDGTRYWTAGPPEDCMRAASFETDWGLALTRARARAADRASLDAHPNAAGAAAVPEWDAIPTPWQRSFELAWEAFLAGTMPVGAVVVSPNGDLVAAGRNRVHGPGLSGLEGSRIAHAEVIALAQLPAADRHWEHVLYSTLEPCLLCFGATLMSRVGRLRYAARDPYSGACGADFRIPILDRKPLAIDGPLNNWLARLSSALVVSHRLQVNTPETRHVSEGFGVQAHDDARHILQHADELQGQLRDLLPVLSDLLS